MSMTIIELGWGRSYAITNDKVSKFLELFEEMHEVDSVYVGDGELVWYFKDKTTKLNMYLINSLSSETAALKQRDQYQEKQNGA